MVRIGTLAHKEVEAVEFHNRCDGVYLNDR